MKRFLFFFLFCLSFIKLYGQGINVIPKQIELKDVASNLVSELSSFVSKEVSVKNEIIKGNNSIILAIGYDKSVDNLKYDGYIVKSLGNNTIVISALNKEGVRNGIYAYLEDVVGVKWLMPGDNWIENNSKKKADIFNNVSIQKSPSFIMRYLSPLDLTKNNDYGKWANRNRLNHIVDYEHNLYKIFAGNEALSFSPVLKGKKYIPKNNSDQRWQPQFNEKTSVNFASKKIISYFKGSKSATISLTINDSQMFDDNIKNQGKNYVGMNNYSKAYYSWVKATVDNVDSNYGRNPTFGLLAYNNVITPPSFRLQDNVIPFITYERFRWVKEEQKNNDISNLISWKKVAKNVGWYDYIYGINYLVPRSYFPLISQYLTRGNQLGVQYYVAELYPNLLEGPKGWIVSKLLWQPDQNVDLLLKEWCDLAVGYESAPYLVEFYKLWGQFWPEMAKNSKWYRNDGVYLRFNDQSYVNDIPIDYLNKSENLLKKALQLSRTDAQKSRMKEIFQAWEISSLSVKYFKNINRNEAVKNQIYSLLEKLPPSQMNTEYKIFFKKHTKL